MAWANDYMQFFESLHLRNDLREIVKPFQELATSMALCLPENTQKTIAFQKLLEAKDCAVRAALYKDPQ